MKKPTKKSKVKSTPHNIKDRINETKNNNQYISEQDLKEEAFRTEKNHFYANEQNINQSNPPQQDETKDNFNNPEKNPEFNNIENQEEKTIQPENIQRVNNTNDTNMSRKEIDSKYKILYEELSKKHDLIVKNLANVTIELQKIKADLANEQEAFKVKILEKSKEAQNLVDEKFKEIENNKQEEINKAKLSIYEEIVCKFLNPILLFQSTIENTPNNNPAILAYVQGYSMINNMFNESLDSLNVALIDVNYGDEFNPNFMEAFDKQKDPKLPPNKVVKVVSKGFILNDKKDPNVQKIIKFVTVVVSE